MSEILRTTGYILRKQPYRERGFLVDLFTEDLGRVKILLNYRGRMGRLNLELFTYGEWLLKAGRSFHFVRDYTLLEAHSIRGRDIWVAYYLNELLLRLTTLEHPLSPFLMREYRKVLTTLTYKGDIEPELRAFEIALLNELGVWPDLSCDQYGAPIQHERHYWLSPTSGLFNSAILGGLMLRGEVLIRLSEGRLDIPQFQQELKQLMRFLITPLLEGRPLQSRLWLEKLYRRESL